MHWLAPSLTNTQVMTGRNQHPLSILESNHLTCLTSDGNWGDGKAYRSSSNVDIKAGTCIDINASTNSIWLGRGTGLVWRRKMTAYSEVRRIPFPDKVLSRVKDLSFLR
jgi:hypothetical protein